MFVSELVVRLLRDDDGEIIIGGIERDVAWDPEDVARFIIPSLRDRLRVVCVPVILVLRD